MCTRRGKASEDAARRPCASQEERPYREPALVTPWCRSGLQDCEETDFSCLSNSVPAALVGEWTHVSGVFVCFGLVVWGCLFFGGGIYWIFLREVFCTLPTLINFFLQSLKSVWPGVGSLAIQGCHGVSLILWSEDQDTSAADAGKASYRVLVSCLLSGVWISVIQLSKQELLVSQKQVTTLRAYASCLFPWALFIFQCLFIWLLWVLVSA